MSKMGVSRAPFCAGLNPFLINKRKGKIMGHYFEQILPKNIVPTLVHISDPQSGRNTGSRATTDLALQSRRMAVVDMLRRSVMGVGEIAYVLAVTLSSIRADVIVLTKQGLIEAVNKRSHGVPTLYRAVKP